MHGLEEPAQEDAPPPPHAFMATINWHISKMNFYINFYSNILQVNKHTY